jgi:hypothetical protein
MAQGYFVIYPMPWWRSRWAGAGGLLAVVALGGWLAWPSDDHTEPPRPPPAVRLTVAAPQSDHPVPSATVSVPPVAGLLPAGSPPAQREVRAPSTQVSPGVHITPMSVPPGTTPEPAGPREGDSEPEN